MCLSIDLGLCRITADCSPRISSSAAGGTDNPTILLIQCSPPQTFAVNVLPCELQFSGGIIDPMVAITFSLGHVANFFYSPIGMIYFYRAMKNPLFERCRKIKFSRSRIPFLIHTVHFTCSICRHRAVAPTVIIKINRRCYFMCDRVVCVLYNFTKPKITPT